jgi:hypothetical protein
VTRDHEVGELASIRRQLSSQKVYLDDDELRSAVDEWIAESHELSDADSAREYVESSLEEMLAEHPMFNAPGIAHGSDGFPDACEGCEHYGSACPVLKDGIETRWRERKLEQAESDQAARKIYRQQAIDVGCHRIPEFLEEWDSQHSDFVAEGRELLRDVESALLGDGRENGERGDAVATDGGDRSGGE